MNLGQITGIVNINEETKLIYPNYQVFGEGVSIHYELGQKE